MREMLFRTPSTTLRDLHRDVWRIAHAPGDRGDGNRSFQFRRFPDGSVLVRGRRLPERHSMEVVPLKAGRVYRFDLLVRAAVRRVDPLTGKMRERLVAEADLPEWLSGRMAGFSLLDAPDVERVVFETGDGGARKPAYRVSGRVRVEDPRAATECWANGVGRAKGFGFGMLVLSDA